MIECAFQFESATANVLQVFPEKFYFGMSFDRRAGFFNLLPIHQNFACENQCLCALARRNQSTPNQQFIQSNFCGGRTHDEKSAVKRRFAEKAYRTLVCASCTSDSQRKAYLTAEPVLHRILHTSVEKWSGDQVDVGDQSAR